MANIIRQKRGTSDPSASDFSETAELLVNTTDGGLFTKTDSGSVVEVGAPIVQDKIEEGDSSVEVIDTGSNGTINLITENSTRLCV
ncbi:MAG TPA: hypothetical protein DCW74_05420, partial [Alteromonas australica]|nr:hypothetical protein [Alteromonas australica]